MTRARDDIQSIFQRGVPSQPGNPAASQRGVPAADRPISELTDEELEAILRGGR
jgi:hypothetical protein